MEAFSFTDDDINLIVRFIAHSVESDCDCFSTEDLILAGDLIDKFASLSTAETQEQIEARIRVEGEP